MSVNTMAIEDVYQLLNDVHAQITDSGAGATPLDTSSFVSVAQKTIQQGTDVVYNTLMNTIARTIFSTRPYSRQFKGLIIDDVKWGGIIRKVQFGDTDAEADTPFHLPADGQSVDHYVIKRGSVVETHYYGSDVYEDHMTVFRDQLINAFSGPEQLGSFVAAKANEINNKWVQWTEDLARTMLLNAIAAKYHCVMFSDHTIHLLSEYNALTSQSLTITDIWKPAYVKPFFEFCRARIQNISRDMTLRSNLYQYAIADSSGFLMNLNRHTPERNQKIYLSAPVMDLMETSVLSEVFNDDYLKYADIEKVARWQTADNANTPFGTFNGLNASVSKYVELDQNGTGVYTEQTVNSGDEDINPIFGIIFDEDFCGINIKETIIQNTPMNARGLYYNTYLHANVQYYQDFTEKFCLLMLD